MNLTEMDARLTCALHAFRCVLGAGWGPLQEVAKRSGRRPTEVLSDWAQANWETIVEAAVSPTGGIFVEPYGDGADCNKVGSRVWMPGVASTHVVSCVPSAGERVKDVLSGEDIQVPESGYAVDRFVAIQDNGWYVELPPFDHVLILALGQEAVVRVDEVGFVLRPVSA